MDRNAFLKAFGNNDKNQARKKEVTFGTRSHHGKGYVALTAGMARTVDGAR